MLEMSQEYLALTPGLNAKEPGAIAALEDLAKRGDPYAQMALGDLRIAGEGVTRNFAKGFKLVSKAARQGLLPAMYAEIYLTAKGVGRSANQELARNMLARLAETDRFAAVQHGLLAHATSHETVKQIVPEVISEDPRIVIYRGLFSQAEYAYLKQTSEPKMAPAMILDPATGKGRLDPVRRAHEISIPLYEEDLIVQHVLRTIATATGTGLHYGEPLSIFRYRPGDEYRSHYDAYHKGWTGPQRQKTALIWLNDAFEGGETYFNRLDIKVRGQPGDMLVFDNLDANGHRDDRMEHAGLPVTKGEKWLASRWLLTEDTTKLERFG